MPTPDVRIRLSAEGVAEVVSALKKVQAESTAAANKGSGAFKGFNSVLAATRGLIASLGVVIGAAAILNFAKTAANVAANFRDAGQRIGTTTERVSALAHAAKLAGSDLGRLEAATGIMNKQIEALKNGSPGAAAAFRALGLSARDFAGRDTAERLGIIAERFGQLKTSGEKSALALALFGRSGAQLIPLLNEMNDGIEGLVASSKRLGVVISDETAAALDEMTDNLDTLKQQAVVVAAQFLQGLSPDLNAAMNDVIGDFGESASAAETWGEIMGGVARRVAEIFGIAGRAIAKAAAQATIGFEAQKKLRDAASASPTGAASQSEFDRIIRERDEALRRIEEAENEDLRRRAEALAQLQLNRTQRQGRAPTIVGADVPGFDGGDANLGPEFGPGNAAGIKEWERLVELAEAFEARKKHGLALSEQEIANAHLLIDAKEEILALDEKDAEAVARIAAGLSEADVARIAQMNRNVTEFGQSLQSAATSGLADLFTNAEGSAERFLDTLKRITAEFIIQQLVTAALSYFTGGASAAVGGGAVGSIFGDFGNAATGGLITGPGTGTSDSIPARLSSGEYVVRAASVGQPGVLDMLRAINVRGARAFAEGGLVGGGARSASEPAASLSASLNIGLQDGLTAQITESSGFERAVIRVLAANQRTLGRLG